jgi:archaellum component FlaD/FlaE
MLMRNTSVANLVEVLDFLETIGNLLDEVLDLINKFQSIKKPQSVPALDGKTMITPE